MKIYEQYGNTARTLYSSVSSDLSLLENIDADSKLVGNLPEIISHFQESSYSKKTNKMRFYVANAEAAIECISRKVFVIYNNTEYDAREISGLKLELMKLSIADDAKLAESIAKKVIMKSLENFPMTSIADAANLVASATKLYDEADALGFALWFMSKKEERILNTKRINKLGKSSLMAQSAMTVEMMNSHCGVIVDNGPTGVGKSLRSIKLAKKAMKKGKKVAIICHRVSISYATHYQIPGSFHYQNIENPAELDSAQCLIIVVNSIHFSNFYNFLSECDLIIIEEAKQLLDHVSLCESKEEFNAIDREKIMTILYSVIKSAKTVVLTDADCNDSTLNFVKHARRDITLLQSEVDFYSVKIEMCEYDSAFYKINAAAKAGKNFIISCDLVKTADGLEQELTSIFGLKVLKITSKNVKDTAQKAFIDNPNVECEKYDVIIYSPIITSTLSITNPRFPLHFGLFTGVVESSTAIQMLRRNRPCQEFIVGIKRNSKVLSEEISLPAKPNFYEEFVAKTLAVSNFDKNNIGAAFFYTARHIGFEVFTSSNKEEKAFGFSILKQVRNVETSTFIATMMTIKDTVEAKFLAGIELTQQEECDLAERKLIEETIGKTELTVVDIESWKRGGLAIHITNSEMLNVDAKFMKKSTARDSSKMMHDKINIAEKHKFFNQIFSTLGLNTNDFSGSFTSENSIKLITNLRSSSKEFNNTGLYRVRALKEGEVVREGTKMTGLILKEFGLEMVEESRKNTGLRTYKISEKSKKLIIDCIARKNNKLIPNNCDRPVDWNTQVLDVL